MKEHIRLVHEGKKSFKCATCHEKFSSKMFLTYHNAAIYEQKKIKCNMCDTYFTFQGNLNKHVKSVHEGKKLSNATFVLTVQQEVPI